MKITKQELIELNACYGGLERFIEQTQNTDEPVKVTSLIGTGLVTTRDLLWLAGKKLSKEDIIRFACDCVLLNIELIRPYTDKYEFIVEFLKKPTIEDSGAAFDIVRASRRANRRAACTSSSVYVSVAACATVLASTASVTTSVASLAATAAINTACVHDKSVKAVNELLIKLFE